MSQSVLTPEKNGQNTFWSNFNRNSFYLNEMVRLVNTKGVSVWLEPPTSPVQNYPEYGSIHSSQHGQFLLETVYHSKTAIGIRKSLTEEDPPISREKITRRLRYCITYALEKLDPQHME